MNRTFRRFVECALLCAAVLAVLSTMGCAGEPPRAPPITRPIDEPHAVAIISRAFQALNLEPERNRVLRFTDGREIRLDVAAKGRKFGIAYITRNDADKLGDALPPRRDSDALFVLKGVGEDVDAHVVLLFSNDYLQDDLSGEEHTATTIAAEKKLDLAARDVVRKAEHERWP